MVWYFGGNCGYHGNFVRVFNTRSHLLQAWKLAPFHKSLQTFSKCKLLKVTVQRTIWPSKQFRVKSWTREVLLIREHTECDWLWDPLHFGNSCLKPYPSCSSLCSIYCQRSVGFDLESRNRSIEIHWICVEWGKSVWKWRGIPTKNECRSTKWKKVKRIKVSAADIVSVVKQQALQM